MEFKGYTYGYQCRRHQLVSDEARKSLDLLLETGTDFVCLAISVKQDKYNSTEIYFNYRNTPTDGDITDTVAYLHEKGVKVCLKPMVDTKDGVWRAYINFPDEDMHGGDSYWAAWFDSYSAFMSHYAEIAEKTGCEMLCIGCEMVGTERKETYWRTLIGELRSMYHGKMTYNTNHGKEEKIKWFDALDYIGTSAYFPVGTESGSTKAEMVEKWEKVAEYFENLTATFGKKVIFMEIGCRSALGCASMPWDFTHQDNPRSEEEQANFYESCLEVFKDKPWFSGMFWWDWSTRIYNTAEEAGKDAQFNIHLKKAEKIIKNYYLAD